MEENNEIQVPPAWKTLLGEYKNGDKQFHCVTRRYYSTGAFKFRVDAEIAPANQLKRCVLVAEPQEIDLFTYGLTQSVKGVQLGDRTATLADTNISEASETNDEDFAVMGLAAYSRGIRFKFTSGANTPFTDPTKHGYKAVHGGEEHLVDPGSHVVPPEVGSPLVLEDTLMRALKKCVSLRTMWNRKEGDFLGLLRQLPEGGAESYLHTSGEPRVDNVYKLSEGYIWRREGSTTDSKFALKLKVEEPVVFLVTDPNGLPANQLTEDLGVLQEVHFDLAVELHGFAFYYPSRNN